MDFYFRFSDLFFRSSKKRKIKWIGIFEKENNTKKLVKKCVIEIVIKYSLKEL